MTYTPNFELPKGHVYVVNISGPVELPHEGRTVTTGHLWHMSEAEAAMQPTEGHMRWKVLESLEGYEPPPTPEEEAAAEAERQAAAQAAPEPDEDTGELVPNEPSALDEDADELSAPVDSESGEPVADEDAADSASDDREPEETPETVDTSGPAEPEPPLAPGSALARFRAAHPVPQNPVAHPQASGILHPAGDPDPSLIGEDA